MDLMLSGSWYRLNGGENDGRLGALSDWTVGLGVAFLIRPGTETLADIVGEIDSVMFWV
jgi:hypothetical protein